MCLYRCVESYFQHSDFRGSIKGLLNSGTWHEVNLIASDSGSVRGGHYHKETEECFIILSGLILVTFRKPISGSLDQVDKIEFRGGDVFIVSTHVEHTFEIIEAAEWINLLSKPMDSQNPDFFKYQT